MSTNTDPNGNRRPGEPFKYKPGKLLEPADGMEERFTATGMLNASHEECAAAFGVSRSTLEAFWADHPEMKEAFQHGKLLRRIKLRRTLDMHANLDAPTARFLAKNELGLSDDPSKAKADEAQAKALKRMGRQEANSRILELTAKLVGETVNGRETIPERRIVSRETISDVSQGGDDAKAAMPVQSAGDVSRVPRDRLRHGSIPETGGAGQAQALPQGETRTAIEKLAQRLGELEASAVRKSPRKDGQPHTDRTKPPAAVAEPPNRGQTRAVSHGPALLSGPRRPR